MSKSIAIMVMVNWKTERDDILRRLRENDPTLTELSVYNNQIGDEGAKALADALKVNRTLTILYVSSNQIGEQLKKELASLVKENEENPEAAQRRVEEAEAAPAEATVSQIEFQAIQLQLEQMQQQQELLKKQQSNKNDSVFNKLMELKNTQNLQEVMIISILYIIFSTSFYKDNITKYLTFITVTNNELNTSGLLITSLIVAILFVIIREFM